jgi:hypothetical protein
MKRKLWILAVCTILSAFRGAAQDEIVKQGSHLSLGLTVGIGVPLGSFGDSGSETDGWAKTGSYMSIDGRYSISERLGIAGHIKRQVNPTDYEGYQEAILVPNIPEDAPNSGYGSGINWGLLSFHVGPTYRVKLSGFDLLFDLGLGVSLYSAYDVTDRGYYNFEIPDPNYFYESVMFMQPSTSFSYELGVQGIWSISDRFDVHGGFSYFGATASVEKSFFRNDGGTITSSFSTLLYSISTANVIAGLYYKL